MLIKYDTKRKVINSLFWKLMERAGSQGIQFIVQIFLARLLMPADYGLITLVNVLTVIANVLVQSGFNTALIQKHDSDNTDFSSVFYLSLFVSILLYGFLFIFAPRISLFYEDKRLISLIRVSALVLIVNSLVSVQTAFLVKKLFFKKLFLSSLLSMLFSGTIGIVLAYLKFGVWALVVQQLVSQVTVSIVLLFSSEWKPERLFSFSRLKTMFSFGWKLLFASLLDTLEKDIRSLVIGKIYAPALLGVYNRGEQFPKFIIANVNGSIQSVMLPALVSCVKDLRGFKRMVRRSIATSAFLVFPLMVGLALISEPLIRLLLTDKWITAAPFLKIFCASYALWPIHTANLQAINALGRSDIFLGLELLKKAISIVILLITIPHGVIAMAYGVLFSGLISSFINAFPNSKLFNYSYREQISDIFPAVLLSAIMGASIFWVPFLKYGAGVTILIQVILGISVYYFSAKILKVESISYIEATILEMVNKHA